MREQPDWDCVIYSRRYKWCAGHRGTRAALEKLIHNYYPPERFFVVWCVLREDLIV